MYKNIHLTKIGTNSLVCERNGMMAIVMNDVIRLNKVSVLFL